MKAFILTIGNELLSGFTLDTNSSWLGKKLVSRGIEVEKIISARDQKEAIKKEIQYILDDKPDYIFITGGLGPTHDDITRDSIKEFFSLEEDFDNQYYNMLKIKFSNRGIDIPENNRSQAVIFKNCKMLRNPEGTARGLFIEYKSSMVFVLPGVPSEMKAIFNDSIKSNLVNEDTKTILTLRTFGISESSLAEKLIPVLKKWENCIEVAFLPSHKGVDIRLNNFKNQDISLLKVVESFNNKIGNYIFGKGKEKLEQIVLMGLKKNNLSLSVAESCTGGRLSQYITSIPGSSDTFLGGIVAYSNNLKINLLGIEKKIIEKYGAVSKNVAIKMAKSIREKTNSNIGIGITGISGPSGGSEKKPKGLVYIAISDQNYIKTKKYILEMNRKMHQDLTSYIALDLIRKYYVEK